MFSFFALSLLPGTNSFDLLYQEPENQIQWEHYFTKKISLSLRGSREGVFLVWIMSHHLNLLNNENCDQKECVFGSCLLYCLALVPPFTWFSLLGTFTPALKNSKKIFINFFYSCVTFCFSSCSHAFSVFAMQDRSETHAPATLLPTYSAFSRLPAPLLP